MPNTVESIGKLTFSGCTSIQGVNINVPTISEQLFKGCTSLRNIALGNNVTIIAKQAFMNDSAVTAITIPDSITVAGVSAFNSCDLRSINTNNIETISANLFAYNIHLSAITMTDSTVTIGDAAFDSAAITSVTIPQNVRSLSDTAFINCNNLQSIIWDVNDTTSSGYEDAFGVNRDDIISVNFGEHCTVIADELCSDMPNMSSVSIPNNITTIGSAAFANSGLETLTIPDSVTSIGESMCNSCESLETVTLGSSVTSIPAMCFKNCSSLETIDLTNIESVISLEDPNAFENCDNLNLIIVPDELIGDYREQPNWESYSEKVFGESVFTITFDSLSGETTPSVQYVRCGDYIENPGTVHKDLYEFEYWEDEDGYQWDFESDYAIGDMTLYAHYREVKGIMIKSISNEITHIALSFSGSYPANVEYSYDGLNWYNIWSNNDVVISANGDYSEYVYFRGYNPNGFSRDEYDYTKFRIVTGKCNVSGNIMYLKDYNQLLNQHHVVKQVLML